MFGNDLNIEEYFFLGAKSKILGWSQLQQFLLAQLKVYKAKSWEHQRRNCGSQDSGKIRGRWQANRIRDKTGSGKERKK